MNKKELEIILKEGEGQFVEFKESPNSTFAKDIVAFSNSMGGRIFFGINDKREINGLKITNELKSRIIDIARNCGPLIKVDIEEFNNVLIINVSEGENKPYQCSDGFFMRIGANSQKLKRDQILEFNIKEGKVRFDEQICENFDFNDFDNSKFDYYLKLAKITSNLSRDEILKNINILTEKGLTNAGVLFFAKEPSKYIRSSRVRCVHFNDNERVEILDKKEVDLGIIGNIEFANNYIKERVSVRYEIKEAKRKEFPEYPEEAYREAIVNAIVHRDYFETSEVAIEKLRNSPIINNPGGLLPSFPKEEFGKLSYPRNKLLADVLSRTQFMERVGTGIKRIKDACENYNNPLDFKLRENYFFVEIGSNKKDTGLNGTLNGTLNINLISLFKEIENQAGINALELSKKLNRPIDTVKKQIKKLVKKDLIERRGSRKTGGYYLKTTKTSY